MVVQSATLAVNERMEARRAAGKPVLHLGFGEAGLPVLPAVGRVLAEAVHCNRYGAVAGSAAARAAAAGYFARRGVPTEPDQIVFGPGSKPLLFALISATPGDVILPQPSWVSYAAQAALAGKRVLRVRVPESSGGVPDPDQLAYVLAGINGDRKPGLMVLTLPDNPTGRLASRAEVDKVCSLAAEYDITVVCDEIYRDLVFAPEGFTSPVELLPDDCVVTTGLSKSMALGGWRVGFARFPDSLLGRRLRHEVVGVASEIWSGLAEPMQVAATYVLGEPAEVTAHVQACRQLHRRVVTAVADELVQAGARCATPQSGFYVYPDFAPLQPRLARAGVSSGAALAEHLLERHGVGVLAGEAFGDDPDALRFRAATSLLYGADDEQRWAALGSDEPTSLPWITDALAQLREALGSLAAL
ncbi:MAG: pyridoxal phosphate-dependent aminotransferase [Acidimicrobiales bacterium]